MVTSETCSKRLRSTTDARPLSCKRFKIAECRSIASATAEFRIAFDFFRLITFGCENVTYDFAFVNIFLIYFHFGLGRIFGKKQPSASRWRTLCQTSGGDVR